MNDNEIMKRLAGLTKKELSGLTKEELAEAAMLFSELKERGQKLMDERGSEAGPEQITREIKEAVASEKKKVEEDQAKKKKQKGMKLCLTSLC